MKHLSQVIHFVILFKHLNITLTITIIQSLGGNTSKKDGDLDALYQNVKAIILEIENKEAAKKESSDALERKNKVEDSLVMGKSSSGIKNDRKLKTKNVDGSISGTVSVKEKKKTWEEKLMLHFLGSETNDSSTAPETIMLQKFMDFVKAKSYTMDNFITDCFADMDEDIPIDSLLSQEFRTHLKFVGLKTIISRYCSPKRAFMSEPFMTEMGGMGIGTVYAARFDSTLTAMRMAFTEKTTPTIVDDGDEDTMEFDPVLRLETDDNINVSDVDGADGGNDQEEQEDEETETV